jgi:ribosomal protein L37AE/L43A
MICNKCKSPIETGRIELGLKTCLRCAKHFSPSKVKGRMVYAHKTGRTIWTSITPNTGYGDFYAFLLATL